jgi:TRAP-type C4-dicarboxylate transport system permease small subunit
MTAQSSTPPDQAWPERLAGWAEMIAMIALLVMSSLVVLQVIARDGFHLGFAWADELARYSGLIIVYLTAPILLFQNKHILVDMAINYLPGRWRAAIDCLIEALMIVFCLLFLWSGWLFIQRAGRFSTPALEMPNLIFYAPVLFGMVLLCAASIVRLARMVRTLARGEIPKVQSATSGGTLAT